MQFTFKINPRKQHRENLSIVKSLEKFLEEARQSFFTHCTKNKVFHSEFLQLMWPNPQKNCGYGHIY